MTQTRLLLRTMGHASIVLYEKGSSPLLLTDPWLVGSVYWRSWWLQNYPTTEELDWLAGAFTVYITHEHPDHFHMPTIRRLGAGPHYLFPALAEGPFLDHMDHHGYRASTLPALTWRDIGKDTSILSIPIWNDDSLLLIDTPGALILNLNDAKPLSPVLKAIRQLVDRFDKPKVLLCSYSPASLINSFSDESGALQLKGPRQYVDYVSRLCDRLAADIYLPFASQVVFNREDSTWANDYRTTYKDLERHWSARARLLPPYTTLNLEDLSHESVPLSSYRTVDPAKLALLVRERASAESTAIIDAEDIAGLLRKLNVFAGISRLIFPRGFSFALGERRLKYDPWRRTLTDAGTKLGDFVLSVPKLAMKEAIHNNHVSDLGISMFVRVRLLRSIDPRKVYALFVMLGFEDYRHFATRGALWRWLRSGVRHTFGLRLPFPAAAQGAAPSAVKLAQR